MTTPRPTVTDANRSDRVRIIGILFRGTPLLALLAVAALTVRTVFSRLPGWNPASLWYDDLVWGAIVRLDSLGEALAIPAHAEPGFFTALWVSRRLFEDPEWSLQLVPFVCGIAAIPVMGLLVKRLTEDDSLGVLAAAITALNPLLAHYTVFVKQYSMGFLITGCLLLGAVWLFQDREIQIRKFVGVASFGSAMLFFSVPSTFASFPIVNLGALRSLSARSRDRRRTTLVLLTAVGYNLALLLAYFLIRGRSNPLVRRAFGRGFMGVRSFEESWEFITTSGRRLVETSLPTWIETPLWNPQTVSWTWPIVAVGFGWLLVRSRTRLFGLVVLSFYTAFLVASALRIYPLGNARTDIFAFPVTIVLFIAGVHALTSWMPKPAMIRGVVGLSTIGFAILQPLHVEYWGVDDARLIRMVEVSSSPVDGLILSPAGGYLAAHYGRWSFRVSATDKRTNATDAEIVRDRTLHLKPWADPLVQLDGFLEDRPSRIWFVDFRSGGQGQNILERLGERGYFFTEVDRTARGRLFMCVDFSLPP